MKDKKRPDKPNPHIVKRLEPTRETVFEWLGGLCGSDGHTWCRRYDSGALADDLETAARVLRETTGVVN